MPGNLADVAGPVKVLEASIAVRVHPAAVACEMILWVLTFPIRREPVPAGGRDSASPWSFIPAIGPEPRRRRPAGAGGQHLHGRVVREDRLSSQHMAPDRIRQRFQQGRRLAHPAGQGRAVQIEPVALEDLALTVERQVVGAFVDQHMRQQARPRTAALDRARWQRRLREGLAARTRKARPHDAVHDEPAGHVLRFFRHILAEAAQRPAAPEAVIVAGRQPDLLARDAIRDRTTLRLVLLLVGKSQRRGHLRDRDLAGLQGQLELLDGLRRGAEPMTAMACQLVPKLLDEHGLRLHLGQQERREAPQTVGVVRQGLGHVQHAKA